MYYLLIHLVGLKVKHMLRKHGKGFHTSTKVDSNTITTLYKGYT